MLFAICFLIIYWYAFLFFQSFYLHRYVSHQMFHLPKVWNYMFCLGMIITQGLSFLRPQHYKQLHMRHHQYSDGPEDLYFFSNYKNVIDLMKRTYNEYMAIDKTKEDFSRLVVFGDSVLTRTLFVLFYIVLYLKFTEFLWFLLLVFIHSLMGLIHGVIVNWCGYCYGYSNFSLQDNSKNTLLLDFLMMGELYQNNHYAKFKRANFAFEKWEIDLTYILFIFLKGLGVV